ncbi:MULTISPECIES: non-ribosomal peptide synthetase [unclassified Bacillus cereus group]|uniref:non-ribosomal peptide synthetase n=1 Tax=unclassified Bacillus cereus group TaxID=2750818 RepID=UPI001F5A9648|nr:MULTISPECIES: non-ribosomal peptide synthetase [unclassified Bacillus cereus group]
MVIRPLLEGERMKNVEWENKCIHQLFDYQANLMPQKVAIRESVKEWTYYEIQEYSNQIAHYLIKERKIRAESPIGIYMERSAYFIIAMLGILKAGGAYVPLDPILPYERIGQMIKDTEMNTVLTVKRHQVKIEKLQWEYKQFEAFLAIDASIEDMEKIQEDISIDNKHWDYIAIQANDEIAGGGWFSSFDGELFSEEEMKEYADNIYRKLKPILNKQLRVLEIGCASGITLQAIAPHVGEYIGVDFSKPMIEHCEKTIAPLYNNVEFKCLAAHEIEGISGEFDLIIMNSVAQTFPSHNYLRNVLRIMVNKVKKGGFVFIGDVMDIEKKSLLYNDLHSYKKKHHSARTKLDWSRELFLSKEFFYDLKNQFHENIQVSCTEKNCTIANELTKYRYDVMLTIEQKKRSRNIVSGQYQFRHGCEIFLKEWREPVQVNVSNDQLAYILYTSGSTGRPKGVMIEHKSVINFIFGMLHIVPCFKRKSVLCTTTVSFDIFVLESLLPLLTGMTILLVNEEILKNPKYLGEYIQIHQPDIIQTTPSRLQWLMLGNTEKIFKSNTIIIIGGEECHKSIVTKLRAQENVQIYHMYGPTETTVWSTGAHIEGDHFHIGYPIYNTRLYVMNEKGIPVEKGQVGELWIGGEGLARGYLNEDTLTNNRFEYISHIGERVYKTGDLVKVHDDGRLDFISRMDQQVKIRGQRVELKEIEERLLKYPGIKDVLVFTRKNAEAIDICACYIPNDSNVKISQIKAYLAIELPHYMIPVYWGVTKTFPMTYNGKVDYKQLNEMLFFERRNVDHKVDTDLEKRLLEIWKNIFLTHSIGTDDDFFELGGHSLLVVQLLYKIRTDLHVILPFQEFFKNPTIRGIAQWLKKNKMLNDEYLHTNMKEIVKGDYENRYEPYQLNQMQQAYLIGRYPELPLGGGGTHVYVEWNCDTYEHQRFLYALKKLMERHPVLKTIVDPKSGVQRIEEEVSLHVKTIDLTGASNKYKKKQLRKIRKKMQHIDIPIDEGNTLFQIGVTRLNDSKAIIHFYYDALILDLWSQEILLEELNMLYMNTEAEIAPLHITFRDYMMAKQNSMEEMLYKRDVDYWKKKLTELPPAPSLPVICSPFRMNQPKTFRMTRRIDKEVWRKFQEFCREEEITPFIALLSVFAKTIALWSEDQSFTLNIPQFQRKFIHPHVENLVGQFASFVPMKFDFYRKESFLSIVRRVQKESWEVLEHSHVHGLELIRELSKRNENVEETILPIVFTGLLHLKKRVDGVFRQGYWISQTSQVGLDAFVSEEAGCLYLNWDIVNGLFNHTMIVDMIDMNVNFIQYLSMSRENWRKSRVELLPCKHKKIIEKQVHGPVVNIPNCNLLFLLEKSFMKNKEAYAIEMAEHYITYHTLHNLVKKEAHKLRVHGVKPGDTVGIVMNKGWEQIVSVLAILYCRATYLPIDAELPLQRVQRYLQQAKAKIVCTQPQLLEKMSELQVPIIHCVTKDKENQLNIEYDIPEYKNDNASIYIIYTSGSTGQPKGVEIGERGLLNVLFATQQSFPIKLGDKILALTALHHDMSVYDIFGLLLWGGTLVIPEKSKDPKYWLDIMRAHNVTIWNSVPAMMEMLLDYMDYFKEQKISSIRRVFLGGDWIPLKMPARIQIHAGDTQVISVGGPTETTLWNIWYEIDPRKPYQKSIPYGSPINNVKYHILNENLEQVPIGVIGTMYCSGLGLAKGYMNNQELTKSKFIIHPETKERMYRTGDLGRYFRNGLIEIVGREDFQVKIHGQRIDLNEIEKVIEQHKGIKRAIAIFENKRKIIIVFYIENEKCSIEGLKKFLKLYLPSYMIPINFIPIATIPLTNNGKVNRDELLQKMLPNQLDDTRVLSDTENQVARIYEEVLKTNHLNYKYPFFALGGSSISAIRIIGILYKTFQVRVPIQYFFKDGSIRTIARFIDNEKKEEKSVVLTRFSDNVVPLSLAQKGVWVMDKGINSGSFCLTATMPIYGELNYKGLSWALEKVFKRHKVLQSVVQQKGKQLVLFLNDKEVNLHFIDLQKTAMTMDEIVKQESQISFDLEKGPLYRCCIIKISKQIHQFVMSVHHIISDEQSFYTIFKELIHYYQQYGKCNVQELPEIVQYAEFCRRKLDENRIEEELDYWRGKLSKKLSLLPIADNKEGVSRVDKGSYESITLSTEIINQLLILCRKNNISNFSGFCAMFFSMLYCVSECEDLIVGIPISTRSMPNFDQTIGLFVHILPLRLQIKKEDSFIDIMKKVQCGVTELLSNSSLPFEKIAHKIGVNPKFYRLPLYITFNFLNMEIETTSVNNMVEFKTFSFLESIVQHQYGLIVQKKGKYYHLEFSYQEGFIHSTTVLYMKRLFQWLGGEMIRNPEKSIIHFIDQSANEKEEIGEFDFEM